MLSPVSTGFYTGHELNFDYIVRFTDANFMQLKTFFFFLIIIYFPFK